MTKKELVEENEELIEGLETIRSQIDELLDEFDAEGENGEESD